MKNPISTHGLRGVMSCQYFTPWFHHSTIHNVSPNSKTKLSALRILSYSSSQPHRKPLNHCDHYCSSHQTLSRYQVSAFTMQLHRIFDTLLLVVAVSPTIVAGMPHTTKYVSHQAFDVERISSLFTCSHRLHNSLLTSI